LDPGGLTLTGWKWTTRRKT